MGKEEYFCVLKDFTPEMAALNGDVLFHVTKIEHFLSIINRGLLADGLRALGLRNERGHVMTGLLKSTSKYLVFRDQNKFDLRAAIQARCEKFNSGGSGNRATSSASEGQAPEDDDDTKVELDPGTQQRLAKAQGDILTVVIDAGGLLKDGRPESNRTRMPVPLEQ